MVALIFNIDQTIQHVQSPTGYIIAHYPNHNCLLLHIVKNEECITDYLNRSVEQTSSSNAHDGEN